MYRVPQHLFLGMACHEQHHLHRAEIVKITIIEVKKDIQTHPTHTHLLAPYTHMSH